MGKPVSRYPKQMLWLPEDRIVFAGDSITDAGRFEDPGGLGFGYVRMIADILTVRYPRSKLRVINRGIGGNTIRDLHARWATDVLKEKAQWIVIMIGINDVWRQLSPETEREAVHLEEFVERYEELILTASGEGARIVLCETSIIEEDPASKGNAILAEYNREIRRLADGTEGAVLVPIFETFLRMLQWRPDVRWTSDGVHPESVGHALLAEAILESVGA